MSQSQWGEDGQGRGGGDEKSPTARPTRERQTNVGDGAARRGATGRQEAEAETETETEEGAGGAGYPPAHFPSAARATPESDTHQRREYGKEAAALVGGPSSAGPAPAEDSHGATGHWHPCGRRGGTEPAAQGTRHHTSLARLRPQPKATSASIMSTEKRRLHRWEAQLERGLRRPRTAMGPQDTDTHNGRRGGTKPQGERKRNRTQPTE